SGLASGACSEVISTTAGLTSLTRPEKDSGAGAAAATWAQTSSPPASTAPAQRKGRASGLCLLAWLCILHLQCDGSGESLAPRPSPGARPQEWEGPPYRLLSATLRVVHHPVRERSGAPRHGV